MSRRFAVRVLKAIFVVSAVSFVLVQLHLRANSPPVDDPPSGVGVVAVDDVHPQQRVVNGLDKALVRSFVFNDVIVRRCRARTTTSAPKIAVVLYVQQGCVRGGVFSSLFVRQITFPALQVEPVAVVQAAGGGDSAVREAAAGLTASAPSIDEIKSSVDFNNAHSDVLNEDKFGPASDARVVIVIQVGVTGLVRSAVFHFSPFSPILQVPNRTLS